MQSCLLCNLIRKTIQNASFQAACIKANYIIVFVPKLLLSNLINLQSLFSFTHLFISEATTLQKAKKLFVVGHHDYQRSQKSLIFPQMY